MYIAADVVANMCASSKNHEELCVIDAGDGKGYLSTRLSLEHNIKVLGVDYNPVNTLGALIRSEKLEVIIVSFKNLEKKSNKIGELKNLTSKLYNVKMFLFHSVGGMA